MPFPNQANTSASAGALGVQQDFRDVVAAIIREIGLIRAALGCSTPSSGPNAGVPGAGGGVLVGIKNWTPTASLPSGSSSSTTVNVPGAAVGDFVETAFDQDLQGCTQSAYVSAANTVTVVITNNTGSAKTLATGNSRVVVYPAASANTALGAMQLTL